MITLSRVRMAVIDGVNHGICKVLAVVPASIEI